MDSNSDPLTPYYISLVGFSIWLLPAQRFACRIQTHAYWPSPSPLRWCLRGCLSGPKNTDCFGDELSVDELIVCLGCSGFPSIRACHLVSPQHPEPEPQKHLLETSMNLDLLKNSAQFYVFFRENDISTESQPWDLGIQSQHNQFSKVASPGKPALGQGTLTAIVIGAWCQTIAVRYKEFLLEPNVHETKLSFTLLISTFPQHSGCSHDCWQSHSCCYRHCWAEPSSVFPVWCVL